MTGSVLKRIMVYAVATISLASSGAVVYLLASQPDQAAVRPAPTVTVTLTPNDSPTPSPTTAPLVDYYVTAKTCLNVRIEPAHDASVIECAPFRSKVVGGERASGWIKVRLATGWGYASATYLSTSRPPAPPAEPRGTVTYERGAGGQSFASGRCANWTVKWVNNSSAEVIQIVFAPPAASYHSGGYDGSGRDYAAKRPRPAVLDVSIPAHSAQLTRFQTCTSTPPPTQDAEFGAEAPMRFEWTWVTGHRGSACYHLGC